MSVCLMKSISCSTSSFWSKSIAISLLVHLVFVAGVVVASYNAETFEVPEEKITISAVMVDLTTFLPPASTSVDNENMATETVNQSSALASLAVEQPTIQPEIPPAEPKTALQTAVSSVKKVAPVKKAEAVIKQKPSAKAQAVTASKAQSVDKPLSQSLNSATSTSKTTNTSVVTNKNAGGAAAGSHIASVSRPKLIARADVRYPKRAYDRRVEGKIKVKYDINANGNVENIRIVEAIPKKIFDREVMLSMKQWRYEAKKAKDMLVTIIFKLNGDTEVLPYT